jgi:competence protein ComEA
MARRIATFILLAALAATPAALAAVVTESFAASAAVGDKHDKVNINTASAKELQKLDGVGHTVAERILHYREEHGPFKRGEDLKKVEGVGAALWERNRERIVVK